MIFFDKIGLVIFHFAWQATVIAMITGMLLFVLRNSTSRIRYTICCFSIMLMLIVPIYFSFSNLTDTTQIINETTFKEQTPINTKEVFGNGKLIGIQYRSQQIQISTYEEIMNFVKRNISIISLIWLLGVALITFYRVFVFSKVRFLIRQAHQLKENIWKNKIEEMIHTLGINRVVTILQTTSVDTPAVIGFFKPVLLIPVSFLTGVESRYVEAILLHELAHIKRYDYLINLLQLIIETLGFFHPAIWWISNRIRKERENCCDDFAVEILGDKLIYAKSLVQLEEMRLNPSYMNAANGSNLSQRVSRLLNKKSIKYYSPLFNLAASSVLILFLITTLGFVALNASDERLFSGLFTTVRHEKLDNNLVMYFPFNRNTNDESKFKHSTSIKNVVLCEDRFGNKNRAYDFNGKNSFIRTDKKNVLNNCSSITVSCWIYPRKTKNWESWISKAGPNWASEWRMGFGENKNYECGFTICNLVSGQNQWTDYWITNAEIPLNKWTQMTVAADQDKGIVSVYMNGNKVGIFRNLKRFEKSEGSVRIGYQTDDGVFFDGKIDDIRIYDRILSDNEVHEVYQMD